MRGGEGMQPEHRREHGLVPRSEHRDEPRWPAGPALLTAGSIGALAVLGLLVRLVEPLSSPVLPAEDPYTHMALLREHTADGSIDPLHDGGALYPPGMHALLAALWAFSGIGLHEIIRFGPVIFGALSVVGTGLLLWRLAGPIAGLVGALGMALAPEAVLRTTMMAPTAVDLALIPFLLLALIELLRGRLAWARVAVPLAVFVAFAHPWLLTILVLAAPLLFALALLAPWPTQAGPRFTRQGIAATILLLGVAWGATLSGCWGACGPGFRDVVADGERIGAFAPLAVGLSIALAYAVARWRALDGLLGRSPGLPMAAPARLALASSLLGLAALVTLPALWQGLPELVDLPAMFGWPLLALAAAGFASASFLRGPATALGLALAASTYPFVIYDPLESPFWPHRTAIYLGVGLILLASVAAAALARWGAHHLEERNLQAQPSNVGARSGAPVVAVLLVALFAAGGAWAGSGDANGQAWYRLYEPCQEDALRTIGKEVSGEPETIVVAGSWQAKLVVAAYTTNASRVWYKADLFTSTTERHRLEGWAASEAITVVVVVDPHLLAERPSANLSFLQAAPYEPLSARCAEPAAGAPTITTHALHGGRQ